MSNQYMVDLDLAKKMKEAGWNKDTIFNWYEVRRWKGIDDKNPDIEYMISEGVCDSDYEIGSKICNAHIVDEILDLLPVFIDEDAEYRLTIEKASDGYRVSYKDNRGITCEINDMDWYFHSNNLVEALAEMWLLLKENKII